MTTSIARITIMGLGRFGGGAAVARHFIKQGAHCVVTDLQSETELTTPLSEIKDCIQTGRVTLRLGEHRETDFTNTDLVIANPAVPRPWENQYLRAAREANVPIRTEIDLVCAGLHRQRIIGVTGTAGKSTTAAMIHHALTSLGTSAHLGGNIGGSMLDTLDTIEPDDWIVLELSSFMLHWLGEPWGKAQELPSLGFGGPRFSPHIAVLTNLMPNHLDWHGSFEHYAQSKENIFRYQQPADHAIRPESVNSADQHIPLALPGSHNQQNACMALEAVRRAVDVPHESLSDALADFRGLPHRLQLVLEHDGLCFFDDSKSTTPEATQLAVSSFDEPARIHLIAGGYDKGADLTPISTLAPSLAGLYTIGATGRNLAAAAGHRTQNCNTLESAVKRAMNAMQSGDILLLSPGCASWDQFTNYEERGEQFAKLVRNAVTSVDEADPRDGNSKSEIRNSKQI